MNRRSFLKSTAALAAAALLPTWLRQNEPHKINLQAFCHTDDTASRCGDMTSPFVQDSGTGLWKYATDARCIVRVDADGYFPVNESVRRPQAGILQWTHDSQRGWKPWPRQDWLLADDQCCLECDGTGTPSKIVEHCNRCDGIGRCWVDEADPLNYDTFRYRVCKGTGYLPCPPCPFCVGKGEKPIGIKPGIQRVGNSFLAAKYDRLLRRELGEMEYVEISTFTKSVSGKLWPVDQLLIRFNGGCGIVCALDQKVAKEHIEKVRGR